MQKKYWEMTTEELREATKEFDEEFVIDKTRPLTPEEQAHWDRVQAALKKSYAAKHGLKPASVRVEPKLAQELTAIAKERSVSLTRLVNELLAMQMDRIATGPKKTGGGKSRRPSATRRTSAKTAG